MVYWIFDLDYTLYSLSKNIPFSYKYLKNDSEIKQRIDMLPGKKGIFTNGTRGHAYNSVVTMGLQDTFHFIDGRDSLEGLKPDIEIYKKFIQKNNMNLKESVIFFEDTLINLQVAKRLGWITVLILGDSATQLFPRPQGADFVFKNIKEALAFFNHHMK